MSWERYLQRFSFYKPVIIEELPEGYQDVVEAYPDRIIIRVPPNIEHHNMVENLSVAKMGEKDYLLVRFYFQPNATQHEKELCDTFFSLCRPLQIAWVYKTMRHYLPEVYEREMFEMVVMYEAAGNQIFDNIDLILSMFAIFIENPDYCKANIEFKIPKGNSITWGHYLDLIKTYARMEPDVNLYVKLAKGIRAPYTVRVATDKDGFRYFEVRGK